MTAPTEAELLAWEALAAKATPAPWKTCPMNMYVFAVDGSPVSDTGEFDDASDGKPDGNVQRIRGYGAEVAGLRREGTQDANIAFIAASREAVPRLLARLRELERERGVSHEHCVDMWQAAVNERDAARARVAVLEGLAAGITRVQL